MLSGRAVCPSSKAPRPRVLSDECEPVFANRVACGKSVGPDHCSRGLAVRQASLSASWSAPGPPQVGARLGSVHQSQNLRAFPVEFGKQRRVRRCHRALRPAGRIRRRGVSWWISDRSSPCYLSFQQARRAPRGERRTRCHPPRSGAGSPPGGGPLPPERAGHPGAGRPERPNA